MSAEMSQERFPPRPPGAALNALLSGVPPLTSSDLAAGGLHPHLPGHDELSFGVQSTHSHW